MSNLIDEEHVAAFASVSLHNAESSHVGGFKVTLSLTNEADADQFKAITKRKKGKAGGRYRMFLTGGDDAMMDVVFLGWTISNTAGAKIKFELQDEDDFIYLRDFPQAKAWTMVLAEIDDDETVVDQKQRETVETIKGGPRSQLAGRLCADKEFQRFVAIRTKKLNANPDDCANFIREKAHIDSRRELDHDKEAFDRFNRWVQRPFAIWQGGL